MNCGFDPANHKSSRQNISIQRWPAFFGMHICGIFPHTNRTKFVRTTTIFLNANAAKKKSSSIKSANSYEIFALSPQLRTISLFIPTQKHWKRHLFPLFRPSGRHHTRVEHENLFNAPVISRSPVE